MNEDIDVQPAPMQVNLMDTIKPPSANWTRRRKKAKFAPPRCGCLGANCHEADASDLIDINAVPGDKDVTETSVQNEVALENFDTSCYVVHGCEAAVQVGPQVLEGLACAPRPQSRLKPRSFTLLLWPW